METLAGSVNLILGVKNTLQGKTSKALYYLQLSKKQNPNGFWTRYFLAYTYDKQGRFTECLEEARLLARDFPQNYRSYVALANGLKRMERYEDSIEALETLMSLSGPKSSITKKALKGKIDNLVLLNKLDDAEKVAKEYHVKWDKRKELPRLSIELRIKEAERLYKDGNTETAKLILEEILKEDPNHAISLGLLGVYYTGVDRQDVACEYFLRAVKLDPKGALPLSFLAETYYNLGNYKLAAKYAKKAIRRNPDFGLPYTILANVYERSKRPGIKMNIKELRREAAMRGDPK